ncbi:MAG TPA: succinyl-diaminopimelate desuccinylase [Egibacteraceae bacterium]
MTRATELTDLLLELCALPCVTGQEGPIADHLAARYERRGERVRRVRSSLVVGEADGVRPTVLLVGHLDVVPPTDADREPRVDGDVVVGRGSSDMKGGLAVAMDCFEDERLRAGPYSLLLVAYAGEEGGHAGNELAPLLEAVPELRAADLAVVLEPTDLAVQLGCLGGLQAEVTVRGRAAHSARPWHGENALTKAGALLAELHERPPTAVIVDGLRYREVVTATAAWTGDPGAAGAARNVVPDRFTINLNYRFAPDKTLAEAEAHLVELVGDRGEVVVVDRAPPGRPSRDAELVAAFTAAVDAPVEAKQAWTDVARFSEVGVPALNYGPGLTSQAHQAGEHVPIANLVTARVRLAEFLSGAVS